jgi:peptidyl-prolyl cis-trans isomerase D
MRAELEDSLQLAEARVELLRTVESLKDLAFNAEDLADPAEALSLEVSRSERVKRNQAEGLFASPQLIAAAFSEEVLEAGHNSEVIELERDHWVVLHVRQHYPAEVKPLEQVREQIIAVLTDQRAREAVALAAEEAIATLRAGTSVEDFANKAGYEWQVELGADRGNLTVPREVLQGAFSLAAPAEGESTIDYVMAANGDALVFELDRVVPGSLQSLPEAEQQALQQLVGAEYAQVIDTEYQQGLRDSAEINVM